MHGARASQVGNVAQPQVPKILEYMLAGSFDVIVGPITDSIGEVVLDEGIVGNKAWLGRFEFYVKVVLSMVRSQ